MPAAHPEGPRCRPANPTDLTDGQWARVEPFLPPEVPAGAPRPVDFRSVVNSLLYPDQTGCQWRMLPRDPGTPRPTVYGYIATWQRDGTWERMQRAQAQRVRTGSQWGLNVKSRDERSDGLEWTGKIQRLDRLEVPVSGDTTQHLRQLIDRLKAGDPAARNELITRAVVRIRRISDSILRRSFPGFRGHEDTVFQEATYRLLKALDTVALNDPQHFLRLVAQKVRQTLLDLVEKARRPLPPAPAEADSTLDPARLAEWTEFQQRTAELPEDQKAVVDLHFFAGLTQAETAELLGLHPRTVSRLWVRATEPLMDLLAGFAVKTAEG